MSVKSVRINHKKLSKSEKQYIRGMVHNLSLQRMTDQEIVDYLHNEKKIDIARTTVNTIKNQTEKQAEKWYIELKQSRYKYIAVYKERLDSLMSYQRRLNEIIEFYAHEHLHPDTVIKAIAELHRIELSILILFKQLPNLGIGTESMDKNENHSVHNNNIRSGIGPAGVCDCMTWGVITHSKCRYCLLVWCPTTLKQDWCPNPDCSHGIKGCNFEPYDDHYEWTKCPICERWFKSQKIFDVHPCSPSNRPNAIEE